jgi:hypothetical protein
VNSVYLMMMTSYTNTVEVVGGNFK